MLVKDIMTRGVEWIHPECTLQEAAGLMKKRDIGLIPVCEGNVLMGIVTDRDVIVRSVAEGHDPMEECVRDVMSPEPICCFEEQDVSEAARIMRDHQVRRLPVLDKDRRLCGIISLGDLAVQTGDVSLAGNTLEAVSLPPHL